MESPIYEEVLQLSLDLVNASSDGFTRDEERAYKTLADLCALHKSTAMDHPLQWEALADFTSNADDAVAIYVEALTLARHLQLNDYVSSILFAMAERYIAIGDKDAAFKCVVEARDVAALGDDDELQEVIFKMLANNWGKHSHQ